MINTALNVFKIKCKDIFGKSIVNFIYTQDTM